MSRIDDVAETPSLRALAASLRRELRDSQLVLMRYPNRGVRETWRKVVIAALDAVLAEHGEFHPPLELEGCIDETDPERWFRQELRAARELTLDQVLVGGREEEPLVLALDADGELPAPWRAFLGALTRAYRVREPWVHLRGVLVLLSGTGPGNPLAGQAGVTDFAHWQPMLWEEMRLLAQRWLPSSTETGLRRAWAISTFAGVANGDPFLLERVCETRPGTIADLVRLVAGASASLGRESANDSWTRTTAPASRWAVPPAMERPWSDGVVAGWTFERGAVFAWDRLPADETWIRLAIWREQVAGLMPSVIELSLEANRLLECAATVAWREAMGRDSRAETAEPGRVLRAFSERGLRMPHVLHALFEALRKVRNKLAHLEVVDGPDIDRLHSAHEAACRPAASRSRVAGG